MENMAELKSSNILITGATGFIGGHLSEELLKQGVGNIVSTYRSFNPCSYFASQKLQEKIIMENCDVKDFKRVLDILIKYKIDIVFHLAAQTIVETAYKNPLETIETNIIGTANILEACRLKGDLKSIVIVSSDKAYGKTKELPYKEFSPLKGDHPYDVSKSAADLISQAYFSTYNLPIVITRFSNVFGPGDINFSRLIPGAIKAIIKNEEFPVRSDGKMIREYTFVKDIIDGCIKLAQRADELKGEAFNFGSKNIFTVLDAIKRMEEILNAKINYKALNIAKNEIQEQYLDWSKANARLLWEPKTSFEQGIKESFDWYKNFYF